MQHQVYSNIPRLMILKFFGMFLVVMPVLVPFFQKTGIGMSGVYLIQTVFAVTTFIMEIPSGYLSDLLGRKKTLVVGLGLHAFGFTLFPFADSLWVFVVAEIILGFAVAMVSGTDTALLYDTLEVCERKDLQFKLLGRMKSLASLGEACASLIAAGLLYWGSSLQLLAIITAWVMWIPFLIALSLREPSRQLMQASHGQNWKYIVRSLFGQSRLLNLIQLSCVFCFAGTLIAVWMFQKYWTSIGIELIHFGLLWALTNFVVSVGAWAAPWVERRVGGAILIAIVGLLLILGYLGISIICTPWGYLACLAFQMCRGLGQATLVDALNSRVSGDYRATANSLVSMGVRILFCIMGPIVGWGIDTKGVHVVSGVLTVFYVGVFVGVLLPLIGLRHQFLIRK